VFTRENAAAIAPHDFLAGTTKGHFLRIGGDSRQFLSSYIPTCPEQFDGPPLTDEERRRYECDVSYVSHASQTPRQFHDQERSRHADGGIRRVIDAMYEMMPAELAIHRVAGGHVIEKVFEAATRACGVMVANPGLRERLMWWYCWRLGDRFYRHDALEWAAAWARASGGNLRLYGNGWDRHPSLSEFARGPAANGRELLCVYRASKINLQLMPAGFIHQRALDGLASGGFFLTRRVPGDLRGRTIREIMMLADRLKVTSTNQLLQSTDTRLHELLLDFTCGRSAQWRSESVDLFQYLQTASELPYPDEVFQDFESITFDSPQDCSGKIGYFLADEIRRRSIATAMRSVVIRTFDYRSTLQRFLQGMRAFWKHQLR
jgi:hypothetical protein